MTEREAELYKSIGIDVTKPITKEEFIDRLKRAGIIYENGEIKERYRPIFGRGKEDQ